ncbi:DUF551 domain-containing protein [Sphingomonas sp. gentR]|uniref:DUF551 domain-containing protein n=1 Tax=Sphingomonas sp. gentR TaxID=3118768 RepID=UPI0030CC48DC
MTDLTERLRVIGHLACRRGIAELAAIGQEAATTLETLRQENARLREAGWRDIESVPIGKTMFVVIGVTDGNGFTGGQPYTTDPCCVWRNEDGSFARWNHHWPPTHWMPLPPAPARKALGGGDEQ